MVVIYAKGPVSNSLRDYALNRGWGEGIRAISDAGLLLSAVRSGRVEIILASNLNGFARSSLELVQVLREFVSRKIALIIPGAGIDTSKCPAKAFLDVLDAIEEFKRATATENIRQGLIAARRKGIRLGRPMKINAYRDDVARLRARGLSGRKIGRELSIPSSTVFKIIGQL